MFPQCETCWAGARPDQAHWSCCATQVPALLGRLCPVKQHVPACVKRHVPAHTVAGQGSRGTQKSHCSALCNLSMIFWIEQPALCGLQAFRITRRERVLQAVASLSPAGTGLLWNVKVWRLWVVWCKLARAGIALRAILRKQKPATSVKILSQPGMPTKTHAKHSIYSSSAIYLSRLSSAKGNIFLPEMSLEHSTVRSQEHAQMVPHLSENANDGIPCC